MKDRRQLWLVAAFVVIFAITRWPGLMPPNFSAAYAFVFCAGLFFPRLLWWWLPLATILATDLLLNLFVYRVSPLTVETLGNYAGFVCLLLLGRLFRRQNAWLMIGGSLIGAIVFYLLTNTISWFRDPGYAKTIAGWIQALTTGLPGFPPTWTFFKYTLLSSGLFSALFVAAAKYSQRLESAAEKKAAEATADSEETESETEPEKSNA